MTPQQIKDLETSLLGIKDITDENKKTVLELKQDSDALRKELATVRRQLLTRGNPSVGLTAKGDVSEDCARYIAAIWIKSAEHQDKLQKNNNREELLKAANDILGMHQRAALTTAEAPLPTSFMAEIVELVTMYGQARKYATTFPLGTGTVKLPKLSTDPAFGFVNMSGTIPGKSPAFAFVTFTANKAGGIIRVPSEIDADSIVALGRFLARYIARQFAKWEDTVAFLGDGTATYNSISGVGKLADTLGKKVQLGATKTAPSDVVIDDLRALRSVVDQGALQNGAYYLSLTFEAYLCSLNSRNQIIYVPNGLNGSTLDGFPIRWVSVMPTYTTTPQASAYVAHFGSLEYYYFGERATPEIAVSKDVYFETEETAIRATERFDWQLMADGAMATLKLAAA